MALIQWLQAAMPGHGWESFWYLASKLYSEEVFLAVLPAVFWVADRRFARYFATLFLGQIWLNAFFKGAFNTPRPAGGGIRIQMVDTEGGFSMPSGHAQGSAAVFAGLAVRLRRPWFTALAVAAAFLVGVSRLYLGVHWPADVAVGWGLGLAMALGLAAAWPALDGVRRSLPPGVMLAAALLLPTLMLWAWTRLAFVARVGLGYQFPAMGAMAGVWLGTLLEERYLGFDTRGSLLWQAVKCAVGIALVLAVRTGLKAVLPAGDWWIFVRYIAIGLAVTLLVPWVLARLRRRA